MEEEIKKAYMDWSEKGVILVYRDLEQCMICNVSVICISGCAPNA